MAARWGAGEDILTTCNMDFSPIETLDQAAGLSPGKALEALQSCSDPSILSIFEDLPAIEAKALDEESEATLLSALTEFLDDVDHNNLSPFETLLDSDLLSHQKCKELSPPRRMLCVSLSSQEKDSVCSVRPSAGKSLSRMQACSVQRSDGEEEDGSLTLSPNGQDSFPDQLEWERLTLPLPITFEQDGEDGLSVSLGDFVRHRHHNCIAICVEDEEGEQILPEGGIILEVVDQGENGEPILAIPNMDFPVSVEQMSPENEHKGLHEAGEEGNDSSEHIVVDDEDVTTNKTASVTPGPCPGLKNEKATVRQEEQIKTNGTSRRKKKKKCKEKDKMPQPAEERVLRSGTVRKMAQETLKKPAKEKKQAVSKALVTSAPSSFPTKAKEMKPFETKMQKEDKMNAHQHELNEKAELLPSSKQEALPSNATPEKGQPIGSVAAERAERPSPTPQPPVAPIEAEGSSAAPSAPQPSVTPESSAASPSSVTPEPAAAVSVAPPAPEPKPKSLSLEEYRRLRQQKRPALVGKQDGNSTKWPSLPEPPKELPPIPCLPDPSPKDPRRANTQAAKKEVEMVRPAWQPRGPAAPPTPEALLVPPAYMISSSSKVPPAALPKPQHTPDPSRLPPPAPVSEKSSDEAPRPDSGARPALAAGPQNPAPPASSPPATPLTPSALGVNNRADALPQPQPGSKESAQLAGISPGTMTDRIKTTAATAAHKAAAVSPSVPAVATSAPTNKPVASENGSSRPPVGGTQPLSPAAFCSKSQCPTKPALLETKEKPTTAVKPQRGKSATQELIEAFTTEIGIEATDLTSLLEQFEETQAKEEQNVPEVCGRAAAVGNSSTVLVPEKSIVERVRANDLSSTAALTPPATPPHQMWKPLAPLTLLGKSKATEATKSNPSKVIQIEAKPLPSVRSHSKTAPADAAVSPHLASMDHDYCLPNKCLSDGEQGKRWNVKQQSFITIKPIKQQAPATKQTPPTLSASSPQSANPVVLTRTQDTPQVELLEKRRCDGPVDSSVLETPDTSPARQETECALKVRSPRRGPSERSYRQHASPRSPSPRCSPQERSRGRYRKRSHHSPSSMSSCSESYSSRSRSPAKKRFRPRHSGSSSRSSSRSSSGSSRSVSRSPLRRRRRFSYSSSRSGSWSRSRSRSPSPQRRTQRDRSRRLCSPSYTHGYGHGADVEEVKRRKEKAIEERRIVYVGRIRGTMTQKELRERFSLFGEIEECTLHFRDHGDNYGFVTYYDTKDAFTAIENGSKLRKPDELPFDLCFGGRRQFCQTSYSDLDSSREYEPLPTKSKFHALDFDTLLKQAQQGLKR